MFSTFLVSKGQHISKNKVLSSTNTFTLLYKLSVKSYISKNNDPNIEPCRTPSSIVSYSDIWPLSETLWNVPLKMFLINWNKFPLAPFCFNLNNNPSGQTLSNDLHLSRKTLRVSRVRLQSKIEKMPWVIASSW